MTFDINSEFENFFEKHEDVFYLLDTNEKKKEILLQHVREDTEITIKYSGEYPNLHYQLIIDKKQYEPIIIRSESIWRSNPPESFEDCLVQIDTFFRDLKKHKNELNSKSSIDTSGIFSSQPCKIND